MFSRVVQVHEEMTWLKLETAVGLQLAEDHVVSDDLQNNDLSKLFITLFIRID